MGVKRMRCNALQLERGHIMPDDEYAYTDPLSKAQFKTRVRFRAWVRNTKTADTRGNILVVAGRESDTVNYTLAAVRLTVIHSLDPASRDSIT